MGGAFYMSEVPDTTLAELTHHEAIGVDTVRFSFDKKASRILDLTKPRIAKKWGYIGGEITPLTKDIGLQARRAGFNVIRYSSERGLGANLAILDDFESLLTPQMIVPTPEFDSALMEYQYSSLGVK